MSKFVHDQDDKRSEPAWFWQVSLTVPERAPRARLLARHCETSRAATPPALACGVRRLETRTLAAAFRLRLSPLHPPTPECRVRARSRAARTGGGGLHKLCMEEPEEEE